MKKLKVKKDFPYDRIGSYSNGNPYQILFIYTPDEAFIVKGGYLDVSKWLQAHNHIPMMIHTTWWRHGVHRSMWMIEGLNNAKAYIRNSSAYGESKRWELAVFPKGKVTSYKKLRRVPRKWMKELTPYI